MTTRYWIAEDSSWEGVDYSWSEVDHERYHFHLDSGLHCARLSDGDMGYSIQARRMTKGEVQALLRIMGLIS